MGCLPAEARQGAAYDKLPLSKFIMRITSGGMSAPRLVVT